MRTEPSANDRPGALPRRRRIMSSMIVSVQKIAQASMPGAKQVTTSSSDQRRRGDVGSSVTVNLMSCMILRLVEVGSDGRAEAEDLSFNRESSEGQPACGQESTQEVVRVCRIS